MVGGVRHTDLFAFRVEVRVTADLVAKSVPVVGGGLTGVSVAECRLTEFILGVVLGGGGHREDRDDTTRSIGNRMLEVIGWIISFIVESKRSVSQRLNLSLFAGHDGSRNSDRLDRSSNSFEGRSAGSHSSISDGNCRNRYDGSKETSLGGGVGGKVSRFGLGHFRRVLHLAVASDLVTECVIGRQRCSRVVDESSWMSVERSGWESGVTRVEAVKSAKISSRIETVPEVVQPLGLDDNNKNQKTGDLCVIFII